MARPRRELPLAPHERQLHGGRHGVPRAGAPRRGGGGGEVPQPEADELNVWDSGEVAEEPKPAPRRRPSRRRAAETGSA